MTNMYPLMISNSNEDVSTEGSSKSFTFQIPRRDESGTARTDCLQNGQGWCQGGWSLHIQQR